MLPVNGPHVDSVYPVHIWGDIYSFVLGSMLVDHMQLGLMRCCRQDCFTSGHPNPKKQEDPNDQRPVLPTRKTLKKSKLFTLAFQAIYKLPRPTLCSFLPSRSLTEGTLQTGTTCFSGEKVNVLHPLCRHKSCSFSLHALCLARRCPPQIYSFNGAQLVQALHSLGSLTSTPTTMNCAFLLYTSWVLILTCSSWSVLGVRAMSVTWSSRYVLSSWR